MATKKAGTGAGVKPKAKKKEDPNIIFESWLSTCTDDQRQTISAVDKRLVGIQNDRKNLKREMQPLRVGMELSRVKEIIVGHTGKAKPQKETGRVWGAYRDSHLKDAGYSKSSSDTYVDMIAAARVILPDDTLITALLDHTNGKGVVMLVGGNRERPFGKFTHYLKSSDFQKEHVKRGKVDLGDETVDDLVINVFDPDNVEEPDTLANMTLAVNTVVKRIVAEVKGEFRPGKNPLDLINVIQNARDYVRYVVECLLTVCNCPDMKDTFEPKEKDIIELDKVLTLRAVVQELNEKKHEAATPTKKKKTKKVVHVRQKPEEKAADIQVGKYTISKNPKPQFPQTPWEVFENGNDKPVARCQDKLQAEEAVTKLLAKDAPSDRPPQLSAAAQQDEEIRKQREPQQGGTKQHDAV